MNKGATVGADVPCTELAPGETFDYVILATQPPPVAARSALSVLADDGMVLCLQSGLCESRVAAIVGEERVSGAIVGRGATTLGPGVYEKTAAGGFTLGYPSGAPFGSARDEIAAGKKRPGIDLPREVHESTAPHGKS